MSEEEIFGPERPDSRDQPPSSSQACPGSIETASGKQRRWPLRQLATVFGIAVLALLGGILVWQIFFPSVNSQLQKGEEQWRAGQQARREQAWDKASNRFDRARAAAESITNSLEAIRDQRPLSEQESKQLGQAYWLLARALFAATAVEIERDAIDKQLPRPAALPDPKSGDVLDLFLIPDSSNRVQALNSLYRASLYIPEEPAVVREALKHRMNEPFEAWRWSHLQKLATLAAENSQADSETLSRAYFVLALVGYHQPDMTDSSNGARLTPTDKKQRSPMLQSLQWLEQLEGVEKPLRFRGVYLRAQIWQWLAEDFRKRAPRDLAASEKYRSLLARLLFDPHQGLPGELGQRAEKTLTTLSPFDLDGVFGLYRLAFAELVRTTSTGSPADTANRIRDLTQSIVRLVRQAERFPTNRGLHAWRAVEGAAQALLTSSSQGASSSEWWREAGQQLDASAEKIASSFSTVPAASACQSLAHLALQLAQAASSHNPSARRQWLGRAETWIKRAQGHLQQTGLEPQLKQEQERLERRLHALRLSSR